MPGAVHGELLALPNASPQGSPEGQAVGSAPGDAMSLMGRGGMGCRIHVLILSFLLPHSPNAEHKAGKSCIEVKDENKGIHVLTPGQVVLAWPRAMAAQEELALMLSQSLGHGGCISPTPSSTAPAKGHCLLTRLPGLASWSVISSSTAVKSAQSVLGTCLIYCSHDHRAVAQPQMGGKGWSHCKVAPREKSLGEHSCPEIW